MKEENVFIQGKVRIGATVAYPESGSGRPAIVIIAGSGDLDRDGNNKNISTYFYRDLAHAFADMGYASVRYDKRGTHATEGDFGTAGLSDYTDDAETVVAYARKLEGSDGRVVICGHSEGGMIACLLASRAGPEGIILLGSAGCSLKDALYYQNRALAAETETAKGLKGRLIHLTNGGEKGVARVDDMFERCSATDKDRIRVKGIGFNAKWLREHGKYSAEDYVRMTVEYGRPVLAVTGKADLSTDYRCLEAFSGNTNVECHAPDNVNHLLKEVDDDNSYLGAKKQYVRLASHPMHAGTMELIRTWLEEKLP